MVELTLLFNLIKFLVNRKEFYTFKEIFKVKK